ncbi:hypothetical protein MM213_01110 [Belliella sp. R4-6]|uniref:Glycosyltransferase n=1 Tax=Belliella alkalica TaxID=1730871 RepID=A0ABS9V7E3_9BACT|nr:hypothetical protein [Belliella alkalica]MCH7412065.1 hypothetical protein [Belliella alkalica]
MNNLRQQLVLFRNFLMFKKFDILAKITESRIPVDEKANFLVSIASYPNRDHLLPAVFQALTRQTVVPKKWILVLSIEDYSNGLPVHLKKLENRGIEILWVEDNPYAVKKLIPVIEKYPLFDVVTLDDDIIYHKTLLSNLLFHNDGSTKKIVGYVGKALLKREQELNMYFRDPKPADLNTDFNQVFLIGWGGIFYPASSLHEKVLDNDAIHRIVPGRGSDIWFWAAAHASNTPQICIGIPQEYNLGIPIPQNNQTKPKDLPGSDALLKRFQMAIDYFGIREKLLEELPDFKNDLLDK